MSLEISIVIPINQAAPFIKKTLRSVVCALNGLNAEVLCVMDNCTDNSIDIITKEIDNFHSAIRILIFDVNLGGVAKARNYGIEKAVGKYIGFVDHDDLVAPKAYKKLLNLANLKNADIVRCGYCIKNSNFSSPQMPNFGRVFYSFFGIFVWNTIYKKSLILTKNIRFKSGYGEDYQFNLEVGFVANKIYWLKENLYYWVQHQSNLHKKRTTADLVKRIERIYFDNSSYLNKDPNSKILILASHSKDLILKTCSRVIWLDNGHIRNDGLSKEITQAYFC